MQDNVIPIESGGHAEFTELYLHLLNAALNEAAGSTAPQGVGGPTITRDQALLKAPEAQAHCSAAHWKLSSARKTGAPARG
jgi:hypothetical protein